MGGYVGPNGHTLPGMLPVRDARTPPSPNGKSLGFLGQQAPASNMSAPSARDRALNIAQEFLNTPGLGRGIGTGLPSLSMPTARVTDAPKTQAPTKNRPQGSPAAPQTPAVPPVTVQSTKAYLAMVKSLAQSMGINEGHMPAAFTLAHIAGLINGLPTSPNMPGKFSLTNIAKAARGGPGTPGYVDPAGAAAAAAQQQYGGAIAGDNRAITQTTAQNHQNVQDIENWYNTLMGQEKSNATADASGYNAAIQGTGNLGGAISSALGFDAGSDGANMIGQTGDIANAYARMAAASGGQFDRNMESVSALSGVSDAQNEMNLGRNRLADLQTTLNSDTKGRGAAYTTALDAARQANVGNAQNYAQTLGGLNSQYQQNWQNQYNAKADQIKELAGLNSAYSANENTHWNHGLALINTALGASTIPSKIAGVKAGINATAANATYHLNMGTAAVKKAEGAFTLAKDKSARQAAVDNSGIAQQIYTNIKKDPNVYATDAATGAVTLKDPAQAANEIGAMLIQAGKSPFSGFGKMLYDTSLIRLGLDPKKYSLK